MKVLQIHSSDYTGGGGGTVAMDRLHRGLRQAGVESKVLCGRKTTGSAYSVAIPHSRWSRLLEPNLKKLTSQLGLNDLHYLHSFNARRTPAYREAEILHFHGTHGYFNYLAIPGLTRNKPAVFTLHDIWPFTGHCAYSYDCERWKIGCGQCPYPDSHPAIKRDNTRLEWRLKAWVYKHSNLVFVSLSNKLTELARQSPLINRFPIYQIPNGIDTDSYQPFEVQWCRRLLGIPDSMKVLMFVSLHLNDYRKGGDLLLKGLQALPESLKKNTLLLMLGDDGEGIAETVGIKTMNLGYVRNDRLKAVAYAAADLFVFPTRMETFGLVLAESMACGTPMVSFGVGGVIDLVRPGVTGYLAEPENAADFSRGIVQLLEDEAQRARMGQECRAIAVREYSLELQVRRHIELYDRLLSPSVAEASPNLVHQPLHV